MGAAPLLVGVSLAEDLPAILGFVTGGGFAVFVAVWFMLRLDQRLKELGEAIHSLELVIERTNRDSFPGGGPGMGGSGRSREK